MKQNGIFKPKRKKPRIIQKLLVKLRLDITRCIYCYEKLKPRGYYYTECENCKITFDHQMPNFTYFGKAYLYEEKK